MDTITLITQAHKGDKSSRDRILIENTALIWSIVKRFSGRGYDSEDLFQIGCIGMLKAIDRFDLGYNVSFSTYAVPLITGEIRRFLRDDGIIKISRTIKENQKLILKEREKYVEKYNEKPTIEQLAKACGLEREDVVLATSALMPDLANCSAAANDTGTIPPYVIIEISCPSRAIAALSKGVV